MTQNEQVLRYMRDYGGISTLDAFRELGCTRLSGRIYDLRQSGYSIKSESITRKNRFGKPVTFAKYMLDTGVTTDDENISVL